MERSLDDHTGFLFTDKDGYPLVAMHWEHRFNHLGLEDAQDELKRLEELKETREAMEEIGA